jgi:hypothetical protein
MSDNIMSILGDLTVRAALKQAWEDSQPRLTGGHEEGGFILRDAAGSRPALQPEGSPQVVG